MGGLNAKNASTMTTKIHVTAKKSLGQNFLVNEGVLDRIVSAAAITPADTILEIGPGTGALTQRLAATGAHIIAIEKDARLIGPLRELFASASNVTIEEGDIMNYLPPYAAGSYKVVANIPYYLTSHLVRIMLEEWPSPSLAVLMVQSEVADRMRAAPPDMNLLALSIQLYATPTLIMRVSRGSFRPVPDVDSAAVKLVISDIGLEERHTAIEMLSLAKRAFAQKRKQLTATLPIAVLERASINPSSRPQELTVDQWKRIAAAFH